ncbi:HAD superfamily hydrolase protein [Rhizobium etli 8C-3]|uniref:HAD superfamily hydrolase protein n=3 Tax=Rhizobium/Agrobacterium group TaxID=227290 RepID=A0A1L5P3G4_RHIET|nr:HAD superfamily hydrolase protein [Rhizobium etli 8C-3]TCU20767.1 putative hydrolase of the HAD superfamily [Rhizobium azibense]TCU35144.1 putative hydrolase of the HAD superfamily [Rhizobium azibense]
MRIFFDVDGVLVDGWHSDPSLRKPWDATIEADLGVDRAAFGDLFFGVAGGRSSSLMADCITGKRNLAEALAEILPEVGYHGDAKDFMRYWFDKDSNINTEVFDLVETIRSSGSGVELYVATGQEHCRARFLWNELGFSKLFDQMFYSAEIRYPKKDIRFFETINTRLHIGTGERPIFFDDQPEIVAVARQAGWDANQFASASDIRQHPRLRHLWASV